MLVGTSGWSYDDWVGEFYPPGLGKDKWLEFYAKYFHTAEVNSTYYSFPSAAVVHGWIAKASRLPGFEYSLKMPKRVTHESLLLDRDHAREFESRVLAPMRDAACLGATLIQLSPYVVRVEKGEHTEHLERLRVLLEGLDTRGFAYAVEFRHRSWLEGGGLAGEVKDLLKERNVAACAVDGPSMPPIVEDTADHSYLRFHGHNVDIWYKKKPDDGRLNRYDYDYGDAELLPWKKRLEPLRGTIRAYFNNHPHANAVKNARLFESLMSGEPAPLKIEKQSDLSYFF
ncbi:MAG TPA: DUF72 domain-containing protein [Methanocella sp.]|nr:DUF72 domain-containing protein [Methanocella sp.]